MIPTMFENNLETIIHKFDTPSHRFRSRSPSHLSPSGDTSSASDRNFYSSTPERTAYDIPSSNASSPGSQLNP